MATPEARPPVDDWATDYDIFDPQYYTDPGPIWADLRQRCPIAHTERWGGSWIATRYEDVAEMARMVPALSNQEFTVVPPVPLIDPDDGRGAAGQTHRPADLVRPAVPQHRPAPAPRRRSRLRRSPSSSRTPGTWPTA